MNTSRIADYRRQHTTRTVAEKKLFRVCQRACPSALVSAIAVQSLTINAKGKSLGRLASRVAYVLQGKHLPAYRPEKRESGLITVYNIDHLKLSAKKLSGVRRHHTGYPGGLKNVRVERIMEKDSRALMRRAVLGMLARNRLRSRLIKKLTLFKGELEK